MRPLLESIPQEHLKIIFRAKFSYIDIGKGLRRPV
jgi:hypothetical protein